MILYTMMPHEAMFPVEESVFLNQQYVSINGVSMIVEKNENQEYRIIRLLSTDPQDYLKQEFSPGSLLS